MERRKVLELGGAVLLALGTGAGWAAPRRHPAQRRPPATPPRPRTPPDRNTPYWTGESGGFRWAWTRGNITARRPHGTDPALSVGDRISGEVARILREDDLSLPRVFEYNLVPLSIVGPVLSFRKESYHNWKGAPHPAMYTSFVAVDATRPEHALVLTDFFPEPQVRASLLGDALVRKSLRTAGVTTPPETLDALVRLLAETVTGEQYAFSEDLLNRFAFHSLAEGGTKVAVRLGLSHGAEVFRGTLTQIGLLLPAPEKLRSALALAAAGKQGFLMREQPKIAGKRETQLFFERDADKLP